MMRKTSFTRATALATAIGLGLFAGSAIVASAVTTITTNAVSTDSLTVDTSTLSVDSANHRVGIGTTSPGAILEAVNPGNTGGTPTFLIKSSLAENVFRVFDRGRAEMRSYSTGGPGLNLINPGSTGQPTFQITSSQGGDSPIFRVFDRGRAVLNSYSTGGAALTVNAFAGGTDALIVTGGDVGIGTTGPGAKLDVQTTGASNVNVAKFLQTDSGDGNQTYAYVGQGLSPGRSLGVGFTDNTDTVSGYGWLTVFGDDPALASLVVKTGGKIGIGTPSPMSKLDVSGGAAIGSYAGSSAAPSNGLIVSGSVGFGTSSPTHALDVVGGTTRIGGDLYFHRDTPADAYITLDASGGNTSDLHITNTSAGAINSFSIIALTSSITGGNVGIGTTTPQSALHVPDGKYAQFEDNNAGAPPSSDCDNDAERGRLSIDTTNNRLYVCNGATRGWDYAALTD